MLLARWPLPAMFAWGAGWGVFALLVALAAPPLVALAAAAATGAALSLLGATRWRRLLIASGFPVSLAASGLADALPAWAWLLPLALLALLYPPNTWRDAPLFPTPPDALAGLARLAPLAPGAALLDAGCGLGDGLRELRREYPRAALHGLEWSWPLRLLAAWRCPTVRVRRGDIWAADWSRYALVYLFQRPESMARAFAKAQREMDPGSWLVSLEFEVAGAAPTQALEGADGRRVWLYRIGAA